MTEFYIDLAKEYLPSALYYEEADTVEYVRRDVASLCERVDDHLTVVLSIQDREMIGFRLKGFKNFYLRELAPRRKATDFFSLVGVLEQMVSEVGDGYFDASQKVAYSRAVEIALYDRVALSDLPQVA